MKYGKPHAETQLEASVVMVVATCTMRLRILQFWYTYTSLLKEIFIEPHKISLID